MLATELAYYDANREELNRQYNRLFIVIHKEDVVASFPKIEMAFRWAYERYPLGDFLVKYCTPDDAAFSTLMASARYYAKPTPEENP